MNKLKILQIHDYPPFEGGGIEVIVSKLSTELVEQGNEVIIATSRFNSETFNSYSNNLNHPSNLKAVKIKDSYELKNLIGWADIVNIHFTFSCRPASIIGLEICNELNKPCVFTIRTNIEHIPFSALADLSELEINNKLDNLSTQLKKKNVTISAPSYDVKRSLEKLGIKKELQVIRNPVLLNQQKINSEIETADLTFIGEISFLKGINYLIDAVRIAKESIPNIKVRLIGGGSDLEHMKTMAKFFNLEKNIKFTGYIQNSEISKYLKQTKIYVHPSLTETWANSVAEALLLKTPVICTNIGGLNELVKNGEYADIVPPAEPRKLAKKIIQNLSSKSDYTSLKLKAIEASKYLKNNLTIQSQASEYLSLYRYLLSSPISFDYEVGSDNLKNYE